MKLLVLTLLLSITLAANSLETIGQPDCQQAVIAFANQFAHNANTNQDEKLAFAAQNIMPLLQACGLEQLAATAQISSACITDLSQGINLLRKIMASTNQVKRALDIILLTKLYQFQIKHSCSFLNQVNFDLKSSGVCLESAYQLSLTVQNMWQHLIQGHTGAALKDLEKFLDDVPDTLDACGDHALAEKIRKDFPAACLKSFEDLAKQLQVFEHNFDHWQWVTRHWKDLEKVLGEVKSSCPVFG